ncbi:alpha/beta hydrolase [Sphingomonas sp.]|uniref:alpha/beta fold hydrolase n=1 Tax=Sphingomonas sp. TaxID=28214 RepID=UPI00286DBDC4|nr:alpha/beta hydrolase [Sphingomonas sp.]
MKWDKALEPASAGEVHPDDIPPSGWSRAREVAWHVPRLLSGLGPLGPRGPEDGPPVIVLPGFLAGDRTTMELRRALARGGWRAHPWDLGTNYGAKPDTLERLGGRIEEIYDGRPIVLLGWSLGGLFARELARSHPGRVRAVVTLGSPFSGDLKTNTNMCAMYEWVAGHDVNQPPFPRLADKPPVPTLALWSRRDGIVAPRAARGLAHEVDKAVEIDTHHMGFALWRPALSRIVAEIRAFLAQIEGGTRGTAALH